MRLLFDIETDGLYHDVSCIHCIAALDLDTNDMLVFNDQGSHESVSKGVTLLEDADLLIGHNIIYYDIPVIKKLYPWFTYKEYRDTLLLSHLRYANLLQVDSIHWAQKKHRLPRRLFGSHSLKAWGFRLDEQKDTFGETSDWKEWSQEMQDYCIQDVHTTHKLWKLFLKNYPGLG